MITHLFFDETNVICIRTTSNTVRDELKELGLIHLCNIIGWNSDVSNGDVENMTSIEWKRKYK